VSATRVNAAGESGAQTANCNFTIFYLPTWQKFLRVKKNMTKSNQDLIKYKLETMGCITTPLLKLPITKAVIKINIKRYRFMQL
jgi:uncharacterized membrane protein YhdT